ncbi:MAG: hypothetical protein RSB72_00725 [Bacilli bacterium]
MLRINDYLKQAGLHPCSYEIRGKVTIVKTKEQNIVVKEKNRSANASIFAYLKSRNFNYYPKIISTTDGYEITEYIKEVTTPAEQKMTDMINLVSLLHNKTTHFKEIDEDDYKKIYEDIANNIKYLVSYYNDIISVIETKVFMSPAEYLFARNISKIYGALNYCTGELEKWQKLMATKKKQRFVVLHNNLDLTHFIRNDKSYLISWDKAKIDLPIFDIYKLYKKQGLDYDFEEILKNYEAAYPLLEEEKKLLFILLSLPNKIEFDRSEYTMCKAISREIDMLYKTEKIISPHYSKEGTKN